jgi:hypothetical protein
VSVDLPSFAGGRDQDPAMLINGPAITPLDRARAPGGLLRVAEVAKRSVARLGKSAEATAVVALSP